MSRNSSKQAQAKGGFTLVELVVVIAVLAILAGVGAVAYNGYIEYAKKGQDRATVGEIMHALELADYADPTLFGSDTLVDVYFTKEGIKVPLDPGQKISGALEDAFGEGSLTSITPSYDGWGDDSFSFDASKLSTILDGYSWNDSSTAVGAYVEAVKNGGSASFSGDIDSLWETVGTLIDISEKAKDDPSKQIPGIGPEDIGHIMGKAIAYSTDSTTSSNVIDKWSSGESFPVVDSHYSAARVARNYAFASYARQQALTAEEEKALDEFTGKVTGPIVYLDYTGAGLSGFKTIKASYVSSGQARIDALAFCGMMDIAGKTVSTGTTVTTETDRNYLNNMSEYLDILGNVLASPQIIGTLIDTSSDSVASFESDNAIHISMTKRNGAIVQMKASAKNGNPDPRSDGSSSNTGAGTSTPEEVYDTSLKVTLTTKGTTSSLTPEKTDITIKAGGKCTITVFNGSTGAQITTRLQAKTDSDTYATAEFSGGVITVTGVSAGTATLTITYGGASTTISVTVE